MFSDLKDRVFIVTGASKGFGLAITEALLAKGARVGMIARSEQGLEQARKHLQADNKVCIQAASVSDKKAMEQAVAAIAKYFGRVDGLVNNAGLAKPSPIAEISENELNLQLQVNIAGVIYGVQAVLPFLLEDNPRIINISSASVRHKNEMAHLSLYAASKAAVERLSDDLRQELQAQNIGVTVVRPGAAATDFASGFDTEKLMQALKQWQKSGPMMDTGMEVCHVAESVCWALQMPQGVAVDVLEVRPNKAVEKFIVD